jgi:outer membrane protein TolC
MFPVLLIVALEVVLLSAAAGQGSPPPLHLPGELAGAKVGAMNVSAMNPRQDAPKPQPADTVGPATLTITLQDALERARANNPQLQLANITAQLAREDRIQAKAGLLPTVNYMNQFIYTQANGTPSGVFVANDGVHVYNSQGVVHGDLFAPGKRADYQRTVAAEAVARAKAEVAARGLIVTVVQTYYGMLGAQHKDANARLSLREAEQFMDISQKQERGGEAAHSDVVKAQIQLEQRQRDAQEAQLAVEKNRIALAVLIFPDFRKDFSVADDLKNQVAMPPFDQLQTLAANNNPDIRAAQAAVEQEKSGVSSARSAFLPTLSFDYFYGIDANQFAVYNRSHQRNLGSSAQAQLTIPVWNWGATRSKVRQAQLHLQQARAELTYTQRQLLANLDTFYKEAQAAGSQALSLAHSLDLSSESLRLTLLRYRAGEVTVLEVVDAQSTLVLARNAYDDGLVRYRLALAELQTLTGSF